MSSEEDRCHCVSGRELQECSTEGCTNTSSHVTVIEAPIRESGIKEQYEETLFEDSQPITVIEYNEYEEVEIWECSTCLPDEFHNSE